MAGKIRVAIVEASPDIHVAIASLLADEADVEVVRHARTLAELADLCNNGMDVLVADLRGLAGPEHEALRDFRRRCPHVRVVVTTSGEEREYGDAAARLLADMWVPKTKLAGELLHALRRMAP